MVDLPFFSVTFLSTEAAHILMRDMYKNYKIARRLLKAVVVLSRSGFEQELSENCQVL